MIGALDLRGRGRVDTKIFPLQAGDHAPSKIKENIKKSLTDLDNYKIRTFYLHNPDRVTPFEQTLEALNDLHKEDIL